MVLESMACSGYKAFRDPIRLDLAPLTVIFGKNNSGKTTLARLPLFIMASLADRKMYALSAKEARFGSSFADLASSDQPHPRLSAMLGWKPSRMMFFDLQRVVSGSGGESIQLRELQLDHLMFRPAQLLPDERREAGDVVMSSADPGIRERYTTARRTLKDILDGAIHIASARPSIESAYETRDPGAPTVAETPHLLQSDADLLDLVDGWYVANLDGARIVVDRAAFAFRIMGLERQSPTNLTHAGRGTQASLPVVTLLLGIANQRFPARFVVVEEPEAHLHPSAHGSMADLAIAAARCSQLLVETHSENFILRLRRRIADRTISLNDLRLYYVTESRVVREVTLDEYGATSDWPVGVFESDVAEAQAIVEAKLGAMRRERRRP
jgi:AAA ATPase-like protein